MFFESPIPSEAKHNMLNKLEYEIIDECKCGPEEFFVLVSSINYNNDEELNSFLITLISLIERKLLKCKEKEISLKDLEDYINKRKMAKEDLGEHPNVVEEYSFEATELGIKELEEKDRPVYLNNDK